jgi:putative membrane protein
MPTETDASPPAPTDRPKSWFGRLFDAISRLVGRLDARITGRLGPPGTPRAPENRTATELAQDRTMLATDRTLMAADRSLMAWMRTSLSMLSFGFTIYKLLQGFQEAGDLKREQSPRAIGLFMTALGTFAMVAGVMEYWGTLKQLRQFQVIRLWRPSFVFALVMAVSGLFLFFSIILKVF